MYFCYTDSPQRLLIRNSQDLPRTLVYGILSYTDMGKSCKSTKIVDVPKETVSSIKMMIPVRLPSMFQLIWEQESMSLTACTQDVNKKLQKLISLTMRRK